MRALDTFLTQAGITKADKRSDNLYVVSEDQLRKLVHVSINKSITELKVLSVQFADPKLKHLRQNLTQEQLDEMPWLQ
jgi:hypothetical protein